MFIFITIAVWIIYVVTFKRFNSRVFSIHKALLPLVLFSIIITIDLGINYVAAGVPSMNDGIGMHGVFSYFVIGEDGWSLSQFYSYYTHSTQISLILLLIYFICLIFNKKKDY